MCGIAGLIRADGRPVNRDRLVGMSEAIVHRGPDAEGMWIEGGCGLAHRRLAIVDLSPTGAQPMRSGDGRYVVTFNGEIYNYKELRHELESAGIVLRSTSDTEILVELYARYGEAMLGRLRGMFAFAIWDTQSRVLFFARDRIGKKPFYYSLLNDEFAFASELPAFFALSKVTPDWDAIGLFLGLQYIPSPYTGFEGIVSLSPGNCGTWSEGRITIRPYVESPLPPFSGTFNEAVTETRRLLDEAVRYRMIADVPVGCFLSGGIDSSAIAALMARHSFSPIKTFTMGFPDWKADERDEAATFAKQIGAEHYSFEAKAEDAVALVDRLVDLYAAPYADSSCLPTYLLAQATSKHVKAVMNGDGGDEAFMGYKRYAYFAQAKRFRALGHIPGLSALSFGNPKVKRMLRTMAALSEGEAAGYAEMFMGSYFSELDLPSSTAKKFIIEHMPDFDRRSYLPDDLCVKMDRATMAHGVEARSPLLDQELVRFAASLPLEWHRKGGKQKAVLQAAVAEFVPESVLNRPKRGFQIPLGAWFRGPLKPLFEQRCLVSGSKLERVCPQAIVQKYFDEHQRGRDHGNRLWMLLTLATWLEKHA
ncbi:MAG: asparagine synthase (glutamine-hydrolyzing) [Candidatus Uhrbacteria bacterium]